MFMNKLKTYITTYLFSFIGYCMLISIPYLFKYLYDSKEGILSNISSTIFLIMVIGIYPISFIFICYIIELGFKKIFKYKFKYQIKNKKIDFIFKLGIFLGLLPYVLTLSGILFCFALFLLIPEKFLSMLILKIITISGMSYCCYIIAKYIFKKDTV